MLRLYTSLVLVGIVAGIVLVGTSQAGAAPRRQLQPFTIDLVSVASDGSPGNADSTSPSLSADGRVVAFASVATNLAAEMWLQGQRPGRTPAGCCWVCLRWG